MIDSILDFKEKKHDLGLATMSMISGPCIVGDDVVSRTQNSLRNIKVSLLFQGLRIISTFFARKVFVLVLTQEYLGLTGTFSNILSMLSLAELGIGGAITYSLYQPLAEGNEKQVAARMALFRRTYCIIGLAMILLGGALTPFLPVLIRDIPDIPQIRLIYLLFVLNTALSYFFSYKQALITADQRQYITTTCHLLVSILLQLAQALFLWVTGDYFTYLELQIGATLLENLILSQIANRLYPYLNANQHEKIDPKAKQKIIRNMKAMVTHKMGGIVVFGTDNLLISAFFGVVSVGLYSNYTMVTGALSSIYDQIYSALTASVGNLGVTADSKQVLTVFNRLNFAGNWLYGFSTVCLTVLLNPFIELWVGPEYLFSQEIVILIVVNFYVTGMRKAVLTFRDAKGLYWYNRHMPIAESGINLIASAILAVPFGVAGIFMGTFISTMTTCFWVEPVVLFKRGLYAPVRPFFRDYATNTVVTVLTAAAVWQSCAVLPGTGLPLFVGKMAMCAVLGNAGNLIAYHKRDEFHYFVDLLKSLLPWKK